MAAPKVLFVEPVQARVTHRYPQVRERTVPLPPSLAAKPADYLADTHLDYNTPTAVLWPRRRHGNQVHKPVLDWSAPLDLNALQSKIIRPALAAIGLPASRPATIADHGTAAPATKVFGCRISCARRWSCGLPTAATAALSH